MTPTLRACLWMVGAIVSFTGMAIAGRSLSASLDTFEIMLFRSLTGIVLVLTVASALGTLGTVTRDRLGLHALRNVAHFTGQNLWFFALGAIPLAQVFALEFTTPIWAVMLAPLILREPLTRFGVAVAAVGFLGALVVARPGSMELSSGVLAGIGCAFFFAVTALLTRKLTRDQSITCILVYLTVLQAVFGLICAGYDGDIALPRLGQLPAVIAVGIFGLTAHLSMTKALSLAPANIVMPIDFARLPIAVALGVLLYDEALDPAILIGAAIIIAANYANIRRSARPVAAATDL